MNFTKNYLHLAVISVFIFVLTVVDLYAQTGMGVGTNTPTEKLDVNGAVKIGNTSTTNAGTIRWTGTEFQGYDGTQWITFGAGSLGWSLTGNAGTTPSSNFIGTTDNQALLFRTNNLDRMTITNVGNVGISTTVPASLFHTSNGTMDETGGWRISQGTSNSVIYNNASNDLVIRKLNQTNQLVLDQNGNVGVGTDGPATKLDIYNGDLQVGRTGNTASSFIAIRGGKNGGGVPYNGAHTNALGRLEFRNTDVLSSNTEYTAAAITSENRPGTDDGDLRFYTTSDLVTTEAMNIDYTGNVGIGTIAADKLHVVGSIRMADGNQAVGYVPVSDANGKMSWTDPTVLISNDGDWTVSGNNEYSTVSGNIGIGTTTPATKLDIYNGDLQVGRTGNTASSFIAIRGGKNGGGVPFNNPHTGALGRLEFRNTDVLSSNTEYTAAAITSENRPGTDDGDLRFYTTSDLVTTEAMNIDYTGNVGIGTIAADRLHVVGNIRMVDGNQAVGYIPVSDANGKMTWTDPATISDGDWTTNGNNIYNANTDNVGVGTTNPQEKLHIVGNQRIQAGRIEFTNTGNSVFVGQGAGVNDNFTNNNNVFIGQNAGAANTNGANNVAVGSGALESNTTAGFNTAIGWEAMSANTTGNNSTAIGHWALHDNIDGAGNLALGSHALKANVNGNSNTAVGVNAGQNNTGSGNVFIGRQAGLDETGSNLLFIDNSSTSSPLIWGNFATNKLGFFGNVGIGTNTANNNLDVKGKVAIGTNFAGASAPGNGLIVEGLVGIGTSNPNRLLTVGNNLIINLNPKTTINSDNNQPLLVGENTNNKAVMIGYDGNDIQGRSGTSLATNGNLVLNKYGGNVGVGTDTPGQKLDVNGKIQMQTGAVTGYISVSDANGTMTWTNPTTITTADDGDWATNGTHIYKANTGNVGIGTTNPTNQLDIVGSLRVQNPGTSVNGSSILLTSPINDIGIILNRGDGSGGIQQRWDMRITNDNTLRYRSFNSDLFFFTNTGNLGIGTATPGDKLHVEGSIRMVDGNQVAGYIPVSDANGTMTWTDPTNISDGDWTVSGSNQYSAVSGNVGIGTTTPTTKLHVEGSVYSADNFVLFNTSGTGNASAPPFRIDGFSDKLYIIAESDGNGPAGGTEIRFRTAPSNVGAADRVVIDKSGNLGIASLSPASILNIYEPDESATQTNYTQAVNNAGILITSDYVDGAYTPGLFWNTINDNSTKPKAGIYLQEANNGTRMLFGTSNNYATGITNSALAISESGNVGIGSTVPNGALEVRKDQAGAITQLIITNRGTSSSGTGSALAFRGYRDIDGNYEVGKIEMKHKAGGVGDLTHAADMVFYTRGTNYGSSVPDERMRLTSNGYLGLGTATPSAHMVVEGSSPFEGTVMLHDYEIKLLNTGQAHWSLFNEVATGKFHIAETSNNSVPGTGSVSSYVLTIDDAAGNLVGIGTTSPSRAKLEVSGAQTISLSYGYLNSSGSTGTSSGTVGYSIYADNRIACPEFNAFSDERIKNIKGTSNSKEDLETLMAIDITDYTLKDTIQKGNKEYKKVIAQQVEKVYPQVVSTITDVIPDIYQLATISEGRISLPNDLEAGDRVKLIFENREETVEIISADAEGFTVNLTDKGQVFVYGREVDDFHTVDYEALSTLNISATQELVKRMAALERKSIALETQNTNLKEKYISLSSDLEVLKVWLNVNAKAEK